MTGRTGSNRGISAVLGTIVIVAIVVTLAAAVGLYATETVQDVREDPPPANVISVEYNDAPGDGDDWVKFTYEGGQAVLAERLMVTSTKKVDIDDGTDFAPSGLSKQESFVEKPDGGEIQVEIGRTWDAGEVVHVGGNGDLSGETVRLVWSTEAVEGKNPGTIDGSAAHVILETTL